MILFHSSQIFKKLFKGKPSPLYPGSVLITSSAFIWAQTISTTTSASVVLPIHWWGVGKTFLPIQTSPKQPCPSFRSRRRDSLGISQASLARPWVCGLATGHTSVRAWHRPSECSETQKSRAKWERLALSVTAMAATVCPSTHCGNGRRAAAGWWTGFGRWCRNLHCPASWSCNVWYSGLWCYRNPALTDSTLL